MQFINIRCSNNLTESIKSELILNRPKQCITKKRELENSQAPEMLPAKKQKTQTLNKFISETYSFVSRSIHIIKNCPGYPSSREYSLWNYCRYPMLVRLINGSLLEPY